MAGMEKPVRLLAGALTGKVYAVTKYTRRGAGAFTAHEKHDVTEDFEFLVVERLAVERERIATAIEDAYKARDDQGWHLVKHIAERDGMTRAARIARSSTDGGDTNG